MFDPELERFKRNIDLHAFAETVGFRVDPRESCRLRSPRPYYVMRDSHGDKISVCEHPKDGHWVFYSWRTGAKGSIIDFVKQHYGENLGHARKRLRTWSGSSAPLTPWVPPAGSWHDRETVQREYGRMQTPQVHPYLEKLRQISAAVLNSPRFVGRVRMDEHGNAVFPHFDAGGLCGWEKKNRGFTGFASGGIKGLWESHDEPDDTELVIAESAIDTLSHAVLFPALHRRYRSIGGKPNTEQPNLIRAAIRDLREGSEVIAATDNDPDGRALAVMIAEAVLSAGRLDIGFRSHLPAIEGQDWNDVLKSSSLSSALLPSPQRP